MRVSLFHVGDEVVDRDGRRGTVTAARGIGIAPDDVAVRLRGGGWALYKAAHLRRAGSADGEAPTEKDIGPHGP
jgi:hypothetical protein